MIIDKPMLFIRCPKCGGRNCCFDSMDACRFFTDEFGSYAENYHCQDCNNDFKVDRCFKYEVTEEINSVCECGIYKNIKRATYQLSVEIFGLSLNGEPCIKNRDCFFNSDDKWYVSYPYTDY